MTPNNEILKRLSKKSNSNLKETFEYRLKNKWLKYSAEIAKRIAAAIEDDEELNQVKLAKLLNVSPQQISKILKGHENLTLESIYKIGNALNTELISFPEYKYSFSVISFQEENVLLTNSYENKLPENSTAKAVIVSMASTYQTRATITSNIG